MSPGVSFEEIAANTAVAGVVGGTAAELTGGKFSNGAITASFLRLFNDEAFSAGLRWFLGPGVARTSRVLRLTEDSEMGQELLKFPEVKDALAIARATPNDGQVYSFRWKRDAGAEPEKHFITAFFQDLRNNRTRALHGSIRGWVFIQSSTVRVIGSDVLGWQSFTRFPPSLSRYLGISYGHGFVLPNNLFGRSGPGGSLHVEYDITIPR